jgi:hypothetical protein
MASEPFGRPVLAGLSPSKPRNTRRPDEFSRRSTHLAFFGPRASRRRRRLRYPANKSNISGDASSAPYATDSASAATAYSAPAASAPDAAAASAPGAAAAEFPADVGSFGRPSSPVSSLSTRPSPPYLVASS